MLLIDRFLRFEKGRWYSAPLSAFSCCVTVRRKNTVLPSATDPSPKIKYIKNKIRHEHNFFFCQIGFFFTFSKKKNRNASKCCIFGFLKHIMKEMLRNSTWRQHSIFVNLTIEDVHMQHQLCTKVEFVCLCVCFLFFCFYFCVFLFFFELFIRRSSTLILLLMLYIDWQNDYRF